ncbi:unnamed protein product [Closterium sp. NIES-65]|nr:unnamed protein product [Closterium sp. NIES-65]
MFSANPLTSTILASCAYRTVSPASRPTTRACSLVTATEPPSARLTSSPVAAARLRGAEAWRVRATGGKCIVHSTALTRIRAFPPHPSNPLLLCPFLAHLTCTPPSSPPVILSPPCPPVSLPHVSHPPTSSPSFIPSSLFPSPLFPPTFSLTPVSLPSVSLPLSPLSPMSSSLTPDLLSPPYSPLSTVSSSLPSIILSLPLSSSLPSVILSPPCPPPPLSSSPPWPPLSLLSPSLPPVLLSPPCPPLSLMSSSLPPVILSPPCHPLSPLSSSLPLVLLSSPCHPLPPLSSSHLPATFHYVTQPFPPCPLCFKAHLHRINSKLRDGSPNHPSTLAVSGTLSSTSLLHGMMQSVKGACALFIKQWLTPFPLFPTPSLSFPFLSLCFPSALPLLCHSPLFPVCSAKCAVQAAAGQRGAMEGRTWAPSYHTRHRASGCWALWHSPCALPPHAPLIHPSFPPAWASDLLLQLG